MTGERERLPRLLALIPYLLAHPGISVPEAAEVFEVAPEQLRRDLQLLWMCGLPGHGPGDLIDLSFEADTISVIFDAGISRPQRLNAEEALSLIVALRALAETPGLTDRDAVERALAKIESAAGGQVENTDTIAVSIDDTAGMTAVVQRALQQSKAVRLHYYTATRDETTDRVIDPMRLFQADGRGYLEAWCRSAEGMRVFRLDRIERAEILDEPSAPPEQARLRDLTEGLYTPDPQHLLAQLQVSPSFGWVADYYPSAEVLEQADGNKLVSLHVADPAWVRSLALGSGGEVRVIAPLWLAEQIRDEAHAALAGYERT